MLLQKLAKLKLTLYTICCTTPLLGEKKIMSAPIPKTKADELVSELSDLSVRGEILGPFATNRYLRNIEQLLKSGVDIAGLWLCKGFVYCISNQPEEMNKAFLNAQKLGAVDQTSFYNQASQYILYGYFEEALKGFALNHDSESQLQIIRVALSTFNYEFIDQLDTLQETINELQRRKARAYELGIDIIIAKKLMDTFFNFLKLEKVRFGLVHHNIIEDEYVLFFEAIADYEIIQKVLNKFDAYIGNDDELLNISQKITIILTPTSKGFKSVAA